MTIEDRLAALESKVEALEKRLSPEGSLESWKKLFGDESGTAPEWTPAIPNGPDEIPRVGDIAAEKLACIEKPDGKRLWVAIKGPDSSGRIMYSEVVPGDAEHCKHVPGTFALSGSWFDVPAGTKFITKALGEWYLEKRPPKSGCVPVENSWELRKKE